MLADLNKNHFEPCLWLLKLDFLILNMASICPYLTEMPNLTIEIFGVRVKSLSDQIKTDSHVILASFCKCFRRKLRKRVNNGKKCVIKTLKLPKQVWRLRKFTARKISNHVFQIQDSRTIKNMHMHTYFSQYVRALKRTFFQFTFMLAQKARKFS